MQFCATLGSCMANPEALETYASRHDADTK